MRACTGGAIRRIITEISMNKNQVNGSVKDAAGKVQQKMGKIVGSTTQQVKGLAKQIEGKIQEGLGDVEQAADDSANSRKT